jgi:hypothetical protein
MRAPVHRGDRRSLGIDFVVGTGLGIGIGPQINLEIGRGLDM